MISWQEVLAIMFVGLAVLMLLIRWKRFFADSTPGCAGCGSCPSAKTSKNAFRSEASADRVSSQVVLPTLPNSMRKTETAPLEKPQTTS